MELNLLTYFGYGVLLGLVVAAYVAWSGWQRRRELSAEVTRLRRHIHDHMEISHEGSEQRKRELEQLRKENENLRVAIKSWQQKPDRRELRLLLIYDRALRQVSATAPGFSAHWENAVREAEQEQEQMDRGLLALARRLVLPPRRPDT